ncbi:MAG: PHP domain protein [Candidatus Scalindua rubra]|uniref:PHP domain protein n=1 Tax=Candidatus Scalindua rubra TaxID=1872076 RepID=A0A1E3XEW8_9BACT|nr:MAG: PHP domain protein [Candidatus Scalindua rubra]
MNDECKEFPIRLKISKMYKKNHLYSRIVLIVFACLFLCNKNSFVDTCYAEKHTLIPGVIHVHTTISNGEKTPEEIVKLAKENGIKVVIFTDHDTMKWTYGVPPLRKIIQKVVNQNSILKYGASNYINTIKELNKKYPDMLIIHGTEAIPFYYWQGSFFKNNLALVNGNEHIMVFGLETPSDYKNLPSVGNGFPGEFNLESIFNLWPVSFFLLGWWFISFRKKVSTTKDKSLQEKRQNKAPGVICFFVGVVFLVNNFPFKTPVYDQYHGEQGVGPYQHLINYANEKNALTFWAHPEVERSMEIGKIKIISSPYEEDLLKTFNYTGIAIYSEGMRRVGPPGGIWDQILLEYCSGKRKKPVWIIGEVDYKVHEFPIDETQTVFLLKEKKKEEILNVLRTGKMYAAMGSANALTLNSFVVEDFNSGKLAFMGDEITITGKPRIRIVVTADYSHKYSDYKGRMFYIDLIRNGKVIKTFEADGAIDITYDDDYNKPGEKVYYRLAIDTSYLFKGIVSNPIFVQFKEKQ